MAEVDGIFKTIKDLETAKELLSKALDEMLPLCVHCIHVDEKGICMNRCEWRYADQVRELLGRSTDDS